MRIRIGKSKKGFTLIEIMVVLAVMAILAAIVVPAVTGVPQRGRIVTRVEDMRTVQDGVDRFNADSSIWPTSAGTLPSTSLNTAAVTTAMLTAIDWSKSYGVGYDVNTFVPNWLRKEPSHADETITVALVNSVLTPAGVDIDGDGNYEYTFAGAGTYAEWSVDSNGYVHMLHTASTY